MARGTLNLDVDTPEKVAPVLRRAAEAFFDAAGELESAWQDPHAGRPWQRIAKILDACAEKIDAALE